MSKHDMAIRARVFVEAAVELLHQAQLEAIGAVGHIDDHTRAVAEAMLQVDRLLPQLDHLVKVTP